MTKIDIFSGFLGAGKTTLIKKLIEEAYQGEKVMLIENEFGEIGIDGGFMKMAGVEITEMNSGCICCSLVGDFAAALKKVLHDYHPDRILIEPSGVGKLSDVILAVQDAVSDDVVMGSYVTVADASKVKMYMKNFGEFYDNQIEHASTIVLSRTQNLTEEKLSACLELIRQKNQNAIIVTTPWDQISGKQILDAMEKARTLQTELEALEEEACCGHHHHHHDEEDACGCDHHHHDDEECGHHHHHHDEECGCEHHHHDHDHEDACGHHHHHDGHDADEVFTSWGVETAKKFNRAQLQAALEALD
ncbi:MAG: GTP-binding protein, partial [Clostridiales bacterium]|nr:GTP-binding protein [Clostridiales bacterium]